VQRVGKDGNREMKKTKCLPIWSFLANLYEEKICSSYKSKKLKHKRRRGGRQIWM
jgi:hypothetical protein